MLSRRTDLKSSASTALHEGTASRLVIPVRFLRICLIYYVSRKYKIDDNRRPVDLFTFYIFLFRVEYYLFPSYRPLYHLSIAPNSLILITRKFLVF